MDYLWTPWRYAYITGAEKPKGCIFCKLPMQDDKNAKIVYRAKQCFVILNSYPYTPGHVMVVPYAHLDELQKLPAETAHEMIDRKSTRLNSSHVSISYAVFCLKKKKKNKIKK